MDPISYKLSSFHICTTHKYLMPWISLVELIYTEESLDINADIYGTVESVLILKECPY